MKINEIVTLYHGTGSPHIDIDLDKSDDFKDFGRGYYLTSYPEQAERWAKKRGDAIGHCWVYAYTLTTFPLESFKILEFLEYNEDWLNFITKNRKYGECPECDIIYDIMADNYFDDLRRAIDMYAQNRLSAKRTLKRIKFKDDQDRDQYCFKTPKAIALLKRTASVEYVRSGDTWKIKEQ